MKIFVYPYSPITIGFMSEFDGYVITTERVFEKYLELGFRKDRIRTVDNIDFKHVFAVVEKLVEEIQCFDEVFTLKENDVEWIDVINDYFFGNRNRPVLALFKDKYYMRSVLQGKVAQPDFISISSETSYDNVPGNGVVKPRRSEASLGVDFYRNRQEFEKIRKSLQTDDEFILEEAVNYDVMFTCDGVYSEGELISFFSNQYSNKVSNCDIEKYTIIHTNENYWKKPSVISRLREGTEEVLKVLTGGTGLIAFHMEWFYNSETNVMVFCEVGARFGGWHIPDIVEKAFGCDYRRTYWELKNGTELNMPQVTKPEKAAAVVGIYANHTEIPENMGELLGQSFKCIQYGSVSSSGASGNSDLLCLIMFVEDDVESVYLTADKIAGLIREV